MQRKLKILISAYACSPVRGSEPGMAWNIIYEIGKYHEVHVITEEFKWKKDIEDRLHNEPQLNENLRFYFIYKRRNRTLRKIWPPSYYWFYKQWQRKAYTLSMEIDKKEQFDLVHQLNMIGFREPGYLWKFKNKPVVWGPVGGFAQMRLPFLKSLNLNDMIYYSGRNILNLIQMNFSIRVMRMANRATIILSSTNDAKSGLFKYYNRESVLINETGAKKNHKNLNQFDKDSFNIVWVGRMIGLKALPLALYALAALSPDVFFKFHIVGGGPNLIRWKKLSERLGISSKCIFYGELPYVETQNIISAATILLFTSLQEGTPHVVLEALSYGIPVICHDANGHGDVINSKCGIKVSMISPMRSIEDFSQAIFKLYTNRGLLNQLSVGSLERAHELSWENKGLQICALYEDALARYNSDQAPIRKY